MSRRRKLAVGALVLIAALVVLVMPRGQSTDSFREADGSLSPNSEARITYVELNGNDHQLIVRGRDKDAPLLLYLNGGPGVPEGILNLQYAAGLEEHYLTVQWDQYGSGRSFDLFDPPQDLTIEGHLNDLHALVEWLKTEYRKDKIILLGHSWGSLLGVRYIDRHPENVALYVGVGQLVDMLENEQVSYAFTLEEARKRGDEDALAALEALGEPPFSYADTITQRLYLDEYGGGFHKPISIAGTAFNAVASPEHEILDLVRFYQGIMLSGDQLWPQIMETRLDEDVPRVEVPVAFILGRHDMQTPSAIAERYFEALEAPQKSLFWIEDAAHNPHWESYEAFEEALNQAVADAGL